MTRNTKWMLLALTAVAAAAAWKISVGTPTPVEKPVAESIQGKSRVSKKKPHGGRGRRGEGGDNFEIPDAELQDWLQQAERDPSATLAKVIAIPEAPKRRELLDWILSAWTAEDREPALEWLREQLPSMPAEPASETMEILLGTWALEEPTVTIGWVEGNIGKKLRADGFQSIAESWASSDTEEMSEWILSTRPSSDIWAKELSLAFKEDDPAKALEWADRINDAGLAEESRQGVIQSWLLAAPEEAEAYLQEHPELVPKQRPEPGPASRPGTD